MTEEKFVDRFEGAITEFAILSRAAAMNEITPDQVWDNLPKGGYTIEKNTVAECFGTLVEGGHLRKSGDKYTITDDGREDIQKLQPLALEVPQFVTNRNATASQQQQRQGMPQKTTTGGGKVGGSAPPTGGSPPATSGSTHAGTGGSRTNVPNRDSTQNKDR